jgi:fructosamine-3-kinase
MTSEASHATTPELTDIAAIKDSLVQYLRTHDLGKSGLSTKDTVTLQELGSGCTNLNFTATNGDKTCVLRVSAASFGQRGDRLATEFDMLQEVAKNPLLINSVPQVYHLGHDTGINRRVLAMEFIPGDLKDFNTLTNEEITHFAQALGHLHAHQVPYFRAGGGKLIEGTYSDALDDMLRVCVFARLETIDSTFCPKAVELITIGLKKLKALRATYSQAFTGTSFSRVHHDLHADNILWRNSHPVFIDWEYAQFNDPAQELDYIFTNNNVIPRVKETFLKHYTPPASDHTILERLKVYELVNRLDDLSWGREEFYKEEHPREGVFITQPKGYYQNAYQKRVGALRQYLAQNA